MNWYLGSGDGRRDSAEAPTTSIPQTSQGETAKQLFHCFSVWKIARFNSILATENHRDWKQLLPKNVATKIVGIFIPMLDQYRSHVDYIANMLKTIPLIQHLQSRHRKLENQLGQQIQKLSPSIFLKLCKTLKDCWDRNAQVFQLKRMFFWSLEDPWLELIPLLNPL